MERKSGAERVPIVRAETETEVAPVPEQSQPPLAIVEDFDEFFRTSTDRVYRALVLATGDRDLAEEATAEAMAQAFQHWAKVSTYDSPTGRVYRVGLNWATSRLRRLKNSILRPHCVPRLVGVAISREAGANLR